LVILPFWNGIQKAQIVGIIFLEGDNPVC
jgi:hypothetical protein